MPRSSRHKSHKQHKHGLKDAKEHTESEEEVKNSKQRKAREEETVMSSGIRVSRDSESSEKRKSQTQQAKISSSNSDSKKRKDKADSDVSDRWNGGGNEEREKEVKKEGFGPDLEKGLESKVAVDSKLKSSKRHESSSERRVENDLNRKEAVNDSKDAKEKERVAEKDSKKVRDVKRERSVERISVSEASRKQGSKMGGSEEVVLAKREGEITEWQIQDDLRNPELEKELEKRIRRRGTSSDKDKRQEDVRDGDDRRLSSRDDRIKNGRYKDEMHKDGRSRDKYRDDFDRNHRYQDDKYRDERSSRDRAGDRSDSKHFKDENKHAENSHKKNKLQDSDRDGSPYVDDRIVKHKENRGRKRSYDDNEDGGDLKSRNSKENRSLTDRARSEAHHLHSDAVDSTLTNNQLKISGISPASVIKDQCRSSSKKEESTFRDSVSEGLQPTAAATRELHNESGVTTRVSECRSMEKPKQKDANRLGELSEENAAASQNKRSPRSDDQDSPIQITEKSPSAIGDRRYSNRTGVRRHLNVEETGWRSSNYKDARDYSASEDKNQNFLLEKSSLDESTQADLLNSDPVPVGSSSFNRTAQFPSSSPSILPSQEEDNRNQMGNRKSNNRYKRSDDLNMGRVQGNAWKGVPNWASPLTNGFIPFQHGPPHSGFPFHAPPVFGVRPSMELNPSGVSYHMHDRPYGWRNPGDDSFPHLHGWDGTNGGVFGDESNIYGRPDWDQNRHLMSGRGWEINSGMWKGQNGSINMELPAPQQDLDYSARFPTDETWAGGQSGHRPRSEWNRPERFPAESIEIKRFDGTPSSKGNTESPPRATREKTPEPIKISSCDTAQFARAYLSKLDISLDLSWPELYKQCMAILEIGRDTTGDCNAIKYIRPEETELVGKGSKFNRSQRSSLFPALTETVFERAFSLYKKQNEALKAKKHDLTFSSLKPEKLSPTSAREEVEPIEDSSSHEHAALMAINSPNKASDMEEEVKLVEDCCSPEHNLRATNSPDKATNRVKEEPVEDCSDIEHARAANSPGNNEARNMSGSCSGDATNQHSNAISGGNVLGNECEVLMPDSIGCRVNLSRIHNSPESTH